MLALSSVTPNCHPKCICSDDFKEISCLDMDVKELNEWNIDGSKPDILIMRESYVNPNQIERKFPNLNKLIFTYPRFIEEKSLDTIYNTKPAYSSIWYWISIVPFVICTLIMGCYENYLALRQQLNQIRFLVLLYQLLMQLINTALRFIGKDLILLKSYISDVILNKCHFS